MGACWNCGGTGLSGHSCGEDTCCCLDQSDNVVCEFCNGSGEIGKSENESDF